ncbi:hypothetical protein AVEN_175920-1 [Araneus ventricosus]|uniref:Uncharacterized protein n=1 Tax=Araneus ventricosus TaxID=182803 RepID=A0A4Y2JKB7_ARAVE|nr:hypothetical protein AVEN_175920-1 [Araneus ventricosus]
MICYPLSPNSLSHKTADTARGNHFAHQPGQLLSMNVAFRISFLQRGKKSMNVALRISFLQRGKKSMNAAFRISFLQREKNGFLSRSSDYVVGICKPSLSLRPEIICEPSALSSNLIS